MNFIKDVLERFALCKNDHSLTSPSTPKRKYTLSIGAIDRAFTASPWIRRSACCTQPENPRYNERAIHLPISSSPFTFDSLFNFARGRRYLAGEIDSRYAMTTGRAKGPSCDHLFVIDLLESLNFCSNFYYIYIFSILFIDL